MLLRISRQHFAQLLDFARLSAPNECCGMLFGAGNDVHSIALAPNVSITPTTRFEIDPQALIDAERQSRSNHAPLLGYFHSHPNGICKPSQTDAEMASIDGRYWLIIAGQNVKAWRTIQNGALYSIFEPVELDTVD